MKKLYLKCIKCQQVYPFDKAVLTCTNHSQYYGYLCVMYDFGKVRFEGNGWGKYLDLLPVESLAVNFSEQKTPLIMLNNFVDKNANYSVYVKDESKNPTGSFKDKESICVINKALECGIDKIFVVSSGNAALSTAAYAQKAGVDCDCIVPKKLSAGKRVLISLYGGKIVEKEGNYEEIYHWAIDEKYPGWNCTPGLNPIKEEGIKIIGFEIWEDLGVPDVIIVPCGNGTLLFGIYKAFKELQFLGLVNKMPKLIGVQIKDAAPLKVAKDQKKDFVVLPDIPDSIAEGIVAQESYSSPKVMFALEETGGEIIEVGEQEVLDAFNKVVKTESMIPEPTSAVVYAALNKLLFEPNSNVVLVQTAGGQKNLKEILEVSVNSKLNSSS
jgi:threonine synthase